MWIRSEKQSIREGFAAVPLKGYRFVPSWFVSLDFVPHVTDAGQVRWHRTEKSALADLADHAHRPRLELIGVLAW